jgi:acyl-CoA reductase-like NAD-dependent aldehyde dehydrogenase
MISDSTTQFNEFFQACTELANLISDKEADLLLLLSQYETHEAAKDEITRSIDALKGVRAELLVIEKPLQDLSIAAIFPLNLPLYSLIIFGIIPSAFAGNLYIRPPEVMHEILASLFEILDIHGRFPVVSLKPTPRQVFAQLYASDCDVIIFTGKYENALAIHKQCPYSLLIYNGSGINPFLLFADADVDLAVAKAVEMRCFNSGQDCAGPDVFFVPSSLADVFTDKLKSALKGINVGDTTDPFVRIGPTMKRSYINELEDWLDREKSHLVFGGKIDEVQNLVYPSIVRKKIVADTDYSFHEFFAPYFYILEYSNVEDLKNVLASPTFQERSMYASVFGNDPETESSLSSVQILKNLIINDIEKGNHQYGGFGSRANFLLYGDQKFVHPILISRDIHQMLNR